jgi:hypothetical protein
MDGFKRGERECSSFRGVATVRMGPRTSTKVPLLAFSFMSGEALQHAVARSVGGPLQCMACTLGAIH